jgi:hypothetical protein
LLSENLEEDPMTEQERRALFYKATGKVSEHSHFEYSMFCKGMDVEREECAKVCDKEQEEWGWDADVVDAAGAIRARGDK